MTVAADRGGDGKFSIYTDTGIVQWDSFADSIIFLHQVRVNTLKLRTFARLYPVFVSIC